LLSPQRVAAAGGAATPKDVLRSFVHPMRSNDPRESHGVS
jgi:hypothetical protein